MTADGDVGGAAPFDPVTAWWPAADRWRATGRFAIEFDAPAAEVWQAWTQFTQTTQTIGRYECTVRHLGDADATGLVRAWRFPMPGGGVGRSFEWIREVRPGVAVGFEGVAAPPLALVSGQMTLTPLGGDRTRLSHVECYQFLNRLPRPLSRPVHRVITRMNRAHVEAQVGAILAERRARSTPGGA